MGKTLEFEGRVQLITPTQSGEGKNGTWEKQQVILEENGQYPNTILIDCFNKPDEIKKISIGATVKALYNTQSKEYNGRYFGSNNLWKFEAQEVVCDNKNDQDPPF